MGITTRQYGPNAKGSKLTVAELDENFNYLNDLTGSGTSGTSGTSGVGANGTSGTSGTSGVGVNGTSGTSGINGSSGSSGTSGINGSSGTSGTRGTSGTSGTTPTLKTINYQSLVGTGNINVPNIIRYVGQWSGYALLNAGYAHNVLIHSNGPGIIDVKAQCKLTNEGTIRLYATPNSNGSLTGAVLLDTFTSATTGQGMFERRIQLSRIEGGDSEGSYDELYLELSGGNFLSDNNTVSSSVRDGQTSPYLGNYSSSYPYLIIVTTSGIYNYTIEYGVQAF